MILIDTQILVWATTGAVPVRPLHRKAMKRFETLHRDGVLVSAISVWEVALKAGRGSLIVNGSIEEWLSRVKRVSLLSLVPLTADVAVAAQTMFGDWPHRDPADRFILATAVTLDVQLLTTDAGIRRYASQHVIDID